MEIKVVGPGCANCKKLLELTKQAVSELAVQADIVYVTDLAEIAKTGVMRTPGLIVDGRVKAMGRVPNVRDIKRMIGGV